MGSPFPGVDPFLEGQGVWHDFHHGFIFCWREMLMRKLPSNYIARVEEHVYLDRGGGEDADDTIVQRIPDVLVEQRAEAGTARDVSGAVTLKPTIVRHIIGDPIREGYIEVVRRGDNTLVAVLELLSPTNKRGVGRGEYLLKRDQILRGPAHLVEVDMLLRGPRMPFREGLPEGHYFAMISRADRRPECEVFPWTVQDRPPAIPIPLETPDADVVIDLHQVYSTTFERGPYDELVRYDRPVGFPMAEDMQKWVGERLSRRAS
ncbi:MAG: hypothetical protein JWN40_3946 [Phycisphaerales bacterium]|nr:hypothetical protein [Phycisphaerales bacterium]